MIYCRDLLLERCLQIKSIVREYSPWRALPDFFVHHKANFQTSNGKPLSDSSYIRETKSTLSTSKEDMALTVTEVG